jgi:hypothetical protein
MLAKLKLADLMWQTPHSLEELALASETNAHTLQRVVRSPGTNVW